MSPFSRDRDLRLGDLLISRSYVYVVVGARGGVGESTLCVGFIRHWGVGLPVWRDDGLVWDNWAHRIVR